MSAIHIYSPYLSNRLSYIVQFICTNALNVNYELHFEKENFEKASGYKINYSTLDIHADLHITPQNILFENDIKPFKIEVSHWNNLPIFFATNNQIIPFDIFAASFYLLTRYEEYLPYTPDLYQRFPHEMSLAFQHHFLHLPIIDLWCMELKKIIYTNNNEVIFKENKFTFLPTYDIDIAYSYLGKGFVRNVLSLAKELFTCKWYDAFRRLKVCTHYSKDPYDSYTFLDSMHEKYKLKPIYFFLIGEHGALDKNLPFESELQQKLIKITSEKYCIGIHPSFASNDNENKLLNEFNKLKTTHSRQHYIRFVLPTTYNKLIALGITDEYSMGYGSINGFRASTSYSFPWYDLKQNQVTTLMLHPFCFMECNSFYEQKYTIEQTYEELLHYYQIIKKVQGNMITIWHNFSLGNEPMWKGWNTLYEKYLQLIHEES